MPTCFDIYETYQRGPVAVLRLFEEALGTRAMMSKHKDPKTVMRYDHGRENLEQNAVNFLQYEEEE